MKKILVAVDGSPHSMGAAHLAHQLARATRSVLTVAHCVPSHQVTSDLFRSEVAYAKNLVEEAARALGGGVTTLLLEGPIAERIAEEAESEGVDLVVIGRVGTSPSGRTSLGSVADRLIHICTRPVLVAP